MSLNEVHRSLSGFMSQHNKELLAAATLVTVFARDLFLMARKDYGVQ